MSTPLEAEVTVTFKVIVLPEALHGFDVQNVAAGIVEQVLGAGVRSVAALTENPDRPKLLPDGTEDESGSGRITGWYGDDVFTTTLVPLKES